MVVMVRTSRLRPAAMVVMVVLGVVVKPLFAQDPSEAADMEAVVQAVSTSSTPTDQPGTDQVRVLVLQESGKPSSTSYARLLTPFPELRSFTVCYRIRLNRFREESTLMSYAVSNDKDNELRMDHQVASFKVSLHSKWTQTNLQTPLRSWAHFCFTYSYLTSGWNIFMDGELRAHGTLPLIPSPLLGNGAYVIGQEQDSFGGGFQRDQSYSGEITQLNFWSTALSNLTIKRISHCEANVEGLALGWSKQEWQLEGEVYSLIRPVKDFCKTSNSRHFTFFPNRFTLHQALHHCKVLGGILAVPQTEEENSLVFQSSRSQAEFCSGNVGASYLWLGANDHETEQQWVYWGSGEPIPQEGTWRGTGPNGGIVENCLVMLYGTFPGQWSDIACLNTYAFCVSCEFENQSVIHLKGLAVCEESPFNLHYFLGEEKGGLPSFSGFFHSNIEWNVTKGAWVLHSLKEEDAMAWWIPPRSGMYPFGTNLWTLGSEICDLHPGEHVNLTFSICGTDKYTCDDGSCINIEQRCDLKVDCPDKSDEAKCSVVSIPQDYRNDIPPPPPSHDEHLPIYVSIGISSFPSIATEDLTFVTALELKLRWMDTRLNYLNLKGDRTLNVLSQESQLEIWTPRVYFSNARGNVFSNLDQGSRIECIMEGTSVVGGPHLSEEMNIFSGSENSLEMGQLYSVTHSCDFDLLMFPFDAQVCTMLFTLVSASSTYMNLIPLTANYTGRMKLIEYAIGHVSIASLNNQDFSTVAVKTSNSLPKTSYFKLVDVWLFFSIVMIFIIVMLQTLIDFSHQKMFDDNSKVVKLFRSIHMLYYKVTRKSIDKINSAYLRDHHLKTNVNVIKIDVSSCQRREKVSETQNGNWMNNKTEHPESSTDIQKPEVVRHLPVYGRAFRRQNWSENQDVNMALMKKSRIMIPIIFFIFNCIYWGTAIKYVKTIEADSGDV
ncbi:uncharacterized protein LOC121863781 isoform X2 [Homarus americanus]|uniref:uncharacterized protein LOC121863781 isoform X2 n=1 Tax=Homarus americanus TaxID=6706 RepID=UPI001C45CD37|nr:uncharacterized protein LOC121863781 isoform X2 [Homarus americanus]